VALPEADRHACTTGITHELRHQSRFAHPGLGGDADDLPDAAPGLVESPIEFAQFRPSAHQRQLIPDLASRGPGP